MVHIAAKWSAKDHNGKPALSGLNHGTNRSGESEHRLGNKTGCHVYGGEGQRNAIVAGCDTIEHAWGLTQEQADMIVAKRLYFDPTIVRYTEPYMDDNDRKNTGGRFRIVPIIERAVSMAVATPGLKIMVGSGVDGATLYTERRH